MIQWSRVGVSSALLCALGAMMGCTSDPPSVPIVEQVAGAFAESQCNWARNCCEVKEIGALLGLASDDSYSLELARAAKEDPAKCEDVFHSDFVTRNATLLDSIRVGRIQVDTGKLNQCAGTYGAAADSCDIGVGTGRAVEENCKRDEIFVGQVAENDPCFHPLDCAPGNSCWLPEDASVGVCRAQSKRGGDCREQGQCGDADVCRPVDTRSSACTPLELQPVDGYCTVDAQCLPNLFCDSSLEACKEKRDADKECTRSEHCLSGRCNEETRKCEASAAKGENCVSDGHCADGLWCEPSTASVALCAVPLSRGDVGENCNATTPCKDGFVCAFGTCEAPRPVGSLCVGDVQCGDTGYCDDGTCVARLGGGGNCTSDARCEPSLYCNYVTEECTPRIAKDESCGSALNGCEEGTGCEAGVCVALAAAGESCTSVGCVDGLICEGFLGACADRVAAGSQCDSSAACPENQYCDASGAGFQCRPMPQVGQGELCNTEIGCTEGLLCYQGTCRAPGNAVGDTCDDTLLPCATGLYCNGFSGCATKGSVGTRCSGSSGTYDEECAEGLGCMYTPLGVYTYSCQPWVAPAGSCGLESSTGYARCNPASSKCAVDYSCVALAGVDGTCTYDADCMQGLECDTGSYTCQAPGTAGDSCASVPCVEGFICNFNDQCEALSGSGADCGSSSECATGLSCQEFGGTCADRVKAGADCATSDECPSDQECISKQTCEARAAEGEDCDDLMPCAEGLRCDPEWAQCVKLEAPAALGARCQVDEQCATGMCSNGICAGGCTGVGK